MYYTRNEGEIYPINQPPPPPASPQPSFPWFAIIGIMIMSIWSSTSAAKKMEKMNTGVPNYIVFDSSKKIVEALGISENDFIEIYSNEELKQKRKSLKDGEYAFLKYNGFIVQTSKTPFKDLWITSTPIGGFASDVSPNGFFVQQGILLQWFVGLNKINACIYVIASREGHIYIYKMEKIINNEVEINTFFTAFSNAFSFEGNRFLQFIAGYHVWLAYVVFLFLIPFIIGFLLRNGIFMPLLFVDCFVVIGYLAFLFIIFQTVIAVHFHHFSKTFVMMQIGFIINAIAYLLHVNLYRSVLFRC